MEELINIAHSIHSNPGVYAVLLGSGVSKSAGIPTGWEVTMELIRRVAAMKGDTGVEDLEAWYKSQFSEEPGYSAILDKLTKTSAERRAILQSFFEPSDEEKEEGLKLPTLAHRSIAKLVSRGLVKVILTTNFDRLMETALVDEGISPVVISTSDGILGAAPLTHQGCVILKLHGDYLDERIKNTEAELSEYPEALDKYLDRIFDDFGLIIAGWSGDWDPALRSALERCPSRRYATYWTTRDPVSTKVQDLIGLRGASQVSIEDADTFFDDIAEKTIALDELSTENQKSRAVKLALLKKYISKSEYRIRLADLLAVERKEIVSLHQAENSGANTQTFDDVMRQRFLAYDAATETLNNMVFLSARWGERHHDEILLQTIFSLVPAASRNGRRGLLDLMIYPAVQVFYHALAGAVMGKNFLLFRRLIKFQFNFLGRSRTSLPDLTAFYAIEVDTQKMLCDTRQYFPFSEHLLSLMKSTLEECGVDPEQFYIKLEILLAMVVIDENDDPNADAWLPYGIFAWNHEDRRKNPILEDARLQGSDWGLYTCGFFEGNFERLEAVHSALESKLAKYNFR